MALKPQDLVVLLKLAAHSGERPPYGRLAAELHMSVSEVHAAVQRSLASGLAADDSDPRPVTGALHEFLVHGARYAFPARLGGPVRGMPTGFAAPALKKLLAPSNDLPPVWPDAAGGTRGLEVAPLYRSVPDAARGDEHLYTLLALVDALRIGGARERRLAAEELETRLEAGLRGR